MGVLRAGGEVGFVDAATLAEDLQELQPYFLNAVPRVFEAVHKLYQAELKEALCGLPRNQHGALTANLDTRFGSHFGDALAYVAIGSAPPSPSVLLWMQRIFGPKKVMQGYGATECGTIGWCDGDPEGWMNIAANVELNLKPVPDLGSSTTPVDGAVQLPAIDGVCARGEILVKTPDFVGCYLGEPGKTTEAFDGEGYYHTGDIGELMFTGSGIKKFKIVGRCKNVVKLANGEFVSPELVEGVLAAIPEVEQIFVDARGGSAATVAIAVLSAAAAGFTEVELLAAFRDAAARAHLERSMVPVHATTVPYTARWTPTNGTMTGSNKIDRAGIRRVHRAELEQMLARVNGAAATEYGAVSRTSSASGSPMGPVGVVISVVAEATSVRASDIEARLAADETVALAELGADSLVGSLVCNQIAARLRLPGPTVLTAWHQCPGLVDFIHAVTGDFAGGTTGAAPAGRDLGTHVANELAAAQAALSEMLLPLLPSALDDKPVPDLVTPAAVVVVTGATGFLGAHILSALLRSQTNVHAICLVRGASPDLCKQRLCERLGQYESAEFLAEIAGRIECVPADLELPRLGIAIDAWARLAGSVDSIIHCMLACHTLDLIVSDGAGVFVFCVSVRSPFGCRDELGCVC